MGVQIGFVGTRFSGTDGVSLESAKWARVLWDHRHTSYWYSGLSDRDLDSSMVVPHAYFGHPDIEWINRRAFGTRTRTPDVTQRIYTLADYLKGTLYEFTRRYDLDLLIVQNALLTIPMNIPLGVAHHATSLLRLVFRRSPTITIFSGNAIASAFLPSPI